MADTLPSQLINVFILFAKTATFSEEEIDACRPDSLSLSPDRLSEEGANLLAKLAGSTGLVPASCPKGQLHA